MNNLIKTTMILLIVFISGCYYDTEERLYPVVSTSCDLTNVTFAGTVKPILQASCLNCHSNSNAVNSGVGIKLENYADVKTYVANGKLMGTVKHLIGFQEMPQGGGKISDCEINQLQKWIDNGILNN
jgi:cytochrome c5